jgi:ribosomal protein L37AE/L43A
MATKQVDRIRCDECGTQNEIWIPPALVGDNLIWCCRSCGSELTRSVVEPDPHRLRATAIRRSADARFQRVH